MELESKDGKQQTVTRLVLCVALAVGLYAVAGKLPALEPYRPWLEAHKVQAIAVAAAVLFGVSLAVFPLPDREEDARESGGDCGLEGEGDPL